MLLHPLVLKDAGKDAHPVGLLALGHIFRLAGFAPVEIALDIGFGQRDARRTAIDHAADRRPMALAKGRDAKQMAEAVVGHGQASKWVPLPAESRSTPELSGV